MKPHLQDLLLQALAITCQALGKDTPAITPVIDATKDKSHGDFATNLAMACAKPLGMPPRKLAELLLANLPVDSRVAKVEIAGPGFINFFLTGDAVTAVVPDILNTGESWGQDLTGAKGRVMVEFVSANPTGPMHVGHGRGAAYGDTLANLFAATGYQVHREYYINDAGRQVDVLTLSVWLRYLEEGGLEFPFPKRCYPADYIKFTAAKLRAVHGSAFQQTAEAVFGGLAAEPQLPEGADDKTKDLIKLAQEKYADGLIERARSLLGGHYGTITTAALADQLATIRATLESFNVRYDQWFSEQSLVESGFARTAIERLKAKGFVYEKDGAQWLKTTDFGDEKDRVLFKADGAATYFANDLAYHVDKLDRGYPLLVDVWGADHHGYIARVRAAIEMLTGRKDALHVALMQFVTLSSGKMGKRSGNFVTLQDLIDEVGPDSTRFFYLSRSHDQHLEFDIDLARSQSNDNPVFYVQYAHARICSVFKQLGEKGGAYDEALGLASLARLDTDEEKTLLTALARYPELLRVAASHRTPHTLAFYLQELAAALHGYYNQHKFLVDDAALQAARLTLIRATQTVLRGALGLLGVKPKGFDVMQQRMATRDYHRPQRPKGAPSRGKVTPRKPLGRKLPNQGTAALGLPLWAWMVVSLSVLVLAAVVYYVSRPVAPMDLVPSSEGKNGKTAKAIEIPPKEPSRFAFYEMLPSYEVVVPDDVINPPKPKPGTARNNLPPQPAAASTAAVVAQAQAELPTDLRPADVQGLPQTKPIEKPADKVVVATPPKVAASKPALAAVVADDPAARLAAEIAREAPPQPTAQLARGEQFLIQVAAFRTRADAEQRVAALTIVGLAARVEQITIDNKDTWFRVRLGPYGNAAAAAAAQQSLKTQGFSGVVMKVKS